MFRRGRASSASPAYHRLGVKWYVGTSGYSYKEWKGTFYPEKLKNDDMLKYYGTKLTSVEINSSFYRMPRRTTLEKWAEEVPDGFRFVLKASKRITHEKRLANAQDSVDYLFGLTEELKDKRGPILFQLHPRLTRDLDLLERFLEGLPKEWKPAFELQHKSWNEDPEVDRLLAAHGAARVHVHRDQDPLSPPETLAATTTWGYLRMRACDYEDADLLAWRQKLEETGWEEVYAFFKHEEEMTGPELAVRFLELQSAD